MQASLKVQTSSSWSERPGKTGFLAGSGPAAATRNDGMGGGSYAWISDLCLILCLLCGKFSHVSTNMIHTTRIFVGFRRKHFRCEKIKDQIHMWTGQFYLEKVIESILRILKSLMLLAVRSEKFLNFMDGNISNPRVGKWIQGIGRARGYFDGSGSLGARPGMLRESKEGNSLKYRPRQSKL